MPTPEAVARAHIDTQLTASGWLVQDYKALNLDIFWLKDEALEDSANLPADGIIAADIVAALEQFSTIEENLKE